jgi:hypothetical protein
VPVYLGDATHLKSLLPHPKAAIFVADYPDLESLVKYLQYLTSNETAYEEHRKWRNSFSYENYVKNKPLMETSWFCHICQWAVQEAPKHHKRNRLCLPTTNQPSSADNNSNLPQIHSYLKQKLTAEWEGIALRPSNSRTIYIVKDGVLRSIPDMNTFIALKLELDKVKVIEPLNLEYMIIGDELPKVS